VYLPLITYGETEIGRKLFFTDRKSYTGIRLVSKSVTVNGVMSADPRYLCGSWSWSKSRL